jgi:hypothetical protein
MRLGVVQQGLGFNGLEGKLYVELERKSGASSAEEL